VAVLTVLYNSAGFLEGFIRSLAAQNQLIILLAYDNASEDGSADMLNTLCSHYGIRCELERGGKNLGFAKANNILLRRVLEEGYSWVLMANNDIEFAPEVFEILLRRAKADGGPGKLVYAPRVDYYDTGLIWYGGGGFSWLKGVNEHYHLRQLPTAAAHERTYAFAPMCFVLLPTAIFRDIGLLDERYFVYFEDADFFLQAWRRGYRVQYLPDLVIRHKVSSSTGGDDSLFSIYHLHKNRIMFIYKHYRGFRRYLCLAVMLASKWSKYLRMGVEQRQTYRRALSHGRQEGRAN
jgi:GT2 family glycosyltransferase